MEINHTKLNLYRQSFLLVMISSIKTDCFNSKFPDGQEEMMWLALCQEASHPLPPAFFGLNLDRIVSTILTAFGMKSKHFDMAFKELQSCLYLLLKLHHEPLLALLITFLLINLKKIP